MQEFLIRKTIISDIPELTHMRWDHMMSYDKYNQRQSVERVIFDQACR